MALFEQLSSFIFTTFLSKNIIFIAIGIFGVGFLIAFHELGHFLFCKLFDIKVPSFSVGMGPKLISRKIGTTEYSISAIPIGGYVEIAQASDDQNPTKEGYYENKPYWQKMLVMSGGILFNMIFAYTVFILLYFVGMPNTAVVYPQNAVPVVSTIIPGGPAQKADLRIGDRILAINAAPINNNIEQFFKLIRPLANQKVTLTLERQGHELSTSITLSERQENGARVGFLGIGFETKALTALPLFEAIKQGFNRTNLIMIATLKSFKRLFKQRNIEGFGGPIMIISQTIKHAEQGIKIFLTFLALISINLAILNLMPLPILDGGQALLATIEAIIRRPLPLRIREFIALGTWILFIVLTLYLSFKDIKFIRAVRAASSSQKSNN